MTRETPESSVLYERGGDVVTLTTDTEKYLASAASPSALASVGLGDTWGFAHWEARADIRLSTLTIAGQSILLEPLPEEQTEIGQLKPRVEVLEAENERLKQRLEILEDEVEALKASTDGEVIVLRTVSREQAKLEIQELFQSGETFFYSDVVRRLGIDLALVVEICQELEEEGDIHVDADAI